MKNISSGNSISPFDEIPEFLNQRNQKSAKKEKHEKYEERKHEAEKLYEEKIGVHQASIINFFCQLQVKNVAIHAVEQQVALLEKVKNNKIRLEEAKQQYEKKCKEFKKEGIEYLKGKMESYEQSQQSTRPSTSASTSDVNVNKKLERYSQEMQRNISESTGTQFNEITVTADIDSLLTEKRTLFKKLSQESDEYTDQNYAIFTTVALKKTEVDEELKADEKLKAEEDDFPDWEKIPRPVKPVWKHSFFEACRSGDLDAVMNLIKQQPYFKRKSYVNQVGEKSKITALHICALGNFVDIAEYLLMCGADLNKGEIDDFTPLHYAAREKDSFDVAQLLLLHGATKDALALGKRTPLHTAAYHGSINVARLLVRNNVDIKVHNEMGETPLHVATIKGYLSVVKYLANLGADYNDKDGGGMTPLVLAVLKNRTDIVKWLLSKSVTIDKQGDFGIYKLLDVAKNYRNQEMIEALKPYYFKVARESHRKAEEVISHAISDLRSNLIPPPPTSSQQPISALEQSAVFKEMNERYDELESLWQSKVFEITEESIKAVDTALKEEVIPSPPPSTSSRKGKEKTGKNIVFQTQEQSEGQLQVRRKSKNRKKGKKTKKTKNKQTFWKESLRDKEIKEKDKQENNNNKVKNEETKSEYHPVWV